LLLYVQLLPPSNGRKNNCSTTIHGLKTYRKYI
jgi:hypothetical protein